MAADAVKQAFGQDHLVGGQCGSGQEGQGAAALGVEEVGREAQHLTTEHAVRRHPFPEPGEQRFDRGGVGAEHLEGVGVAAVARARPPLEPHDGRPADGGHGQPLGDHQCGFVRAHRRSVIARGAQRERGVVLEELLQRLEVRPAGTAHAVAGCSVLLGQLRQRPVQVDHLVRGVLLADGVDGAQIHSEEVLHGPPQLVEVLAEAVRGSIHGLGERRVGPGERGHVNITKISGMSPLGVLGSLSAWPSCSVTTAEPTGAVTPSGVERAVCYQAGLSDTEAGP